MLSLSLHKSATHFVPLWTLATQSNAQRPNVVVVVATAAHSILSPAERFSFYFFEFSDVVVVFLTRLFDQWHLSSRYVVAHYGEGTYTAGKEWKICPSVDLGSWPSCG